MPQLRRNGQRILRRGVVVLSVLIAVNVGIAAVSLLRVSHAVNDNCVRIHRLVMASDRIVSTSRDFLHSQRVHGRLSFPEFRLGLARIAERRQELARADCPPRTHLPLEVTR